jgi:hypothetical protein
MSEISIEDIYEEYNNNNEIWPKNDPWHFYTRKKIENFLDSNWSLIRGSTLIVNAGSSGENYGISDDRTMHVDIIEARIKNKPHHVVANLEKLPLPASFANTVLCVGSVINYVDLVRTISEFARITVLGGSLLLEFECSNTLELLFSKKMNSNAIIRATHYRGGSTKIWYYSSSWVKKVLQQFGYQIVSEDRWHFISPLILKLTGSMNFSAKFASLDPLIYKIPILNNYSSNHMLLAKKISS